MIHAGSIRRLAPSDARDVAAAIAVPTLALLGYLGASDVRIPAALAGAIVAVAWGLAAYYRPAFALSASFPILLIAGTKFRTRDADASLQGVLDAQVGLELALFGMIGIGLLGVWLATRAQGRPSRGELAIAAYAGLALLSTIWSAAPALTFVRATQLVIIAALAAVAVRVLGPSRALWGAARALAIYVCLCSVLAVALPWASGTVYYSDGLRFAWFATHPVEAGTLAAIAAIGLLSIALFERVSSTPSKLGVRAPVFAIVLTGILLLTSSRGPALAFAAGAGVLWVMRIRPTFRAAALMTVSALALAAIVFASDLRAGLDWMANQNSAVSRAFFRGQTADTVLSLNGRLGLWSDVQPAMVGHLLTGYGYQGSRSVLLDTASWAGFAHNALLQTVLDLGIVGAVLLILLLALGLYGALQPGLVPWARAAVAALMVFLIVNAVTTESFAGPPTFETLLLFVCVLCATRGARR